MKVLHIELGKTLVGGPQQVIYIVDGLMKSGCACVVACEPDTLLAQRMDQMGVPVRPISYSGDADFGYFRRLRQLIASEGPDLVHIHCRRGAFMSALVCKLAGVPSILSRRVDDPPSRATALLAGRVNRKVICISEAIEDVMREAGVPGDRLLTIRSAVDADPWSEAAPREAFLAEFGLPPDAVTLGVVAQLIRRKGHRFLFEALQGWSPDNLRLIIFGEGKDRAEIEGELARSGLGACVIMAGYRADMTRWMGNLDLVVHPATAEGLGVALLQASSAGVPVVASAVGGIVEAVRDGENGLLVPPGDVEALRNAVRRLVSDADLRRRMGATGQRMMREEFGCDRMVDSHLKLYSELLAA